MASSSQQSTAGFGSIDAVVCVVPTTRLPELFGPHFEIVQMTSGVTKARCKHCGLIMGKESNGNLRKHVQKHCKVLHAHGGEEEGTGQSSMAHGGGGLWNFDLATVRDRMSKFVISRGLPFSHFDNPELTELIQESLQPRYKHVSRRTLRRDCLKLWETAKGNLIEKFSNLQTGINLTTDIWSAPHGLPESYLCVTAHWIEPSSWQMMKRTIAFELAEYPHNATNIMLVLAHVIEDTYKIEDKIFSMTMDNAANNTAAVNLLKLRHRPALNVFLSF